MFGPRQMPRKPERVVQVDAGDLASKLILERGMTAEKAEFHVNLCRQLGSGIQFSDGLYELLPDKDVPVA